MIFLQKPSLAVWESRRCGWLWVDVQPVFNPPKYVSNEPKTRPKQQYNMDGSKTGVCVSADQQVSEQQNIAMKQL